MSPTFEMLWDCPHCGTKKLLAITHRYCPSCGGMQKAEWRYYPSDADKKEVVNHRFVGADRTCPACRAPNSAAASHCGGCGSPLDAAKAVGTRKDQEGTAFAGESEADAKRELSEAKVAAAAPPAPPPSRRKLWLALGGVGLILVLLVVAFGWKKEVQGRVVGHSWKREIQIEAFGPVREQEWCDHMPAGAYHVSHERAVRDHRKVPDGQECHNVRRDNGDGTFSEQQKCQTRYRDEPIYDDRCHFTVDRWRPSRSATEKGDRLEAPSWPETRIRAGNCIGCEREGTRSAAYVAIFEVNGKRKECELEEARWAELAPGSEWKVKMGAITGSLDCSTLRR